MTLLLAVEAGGVEPPLDVFALGAVLVAAWVAGWIATRVGYPAVLGELLAGIVLGPPLLGLLTDGAGLDALGELGVVLMMLWIGTEIDLGSLRRASGAGLLAAIGGFVVPFAGGLLVMRLFGFDWIAGVFVGAAVGVTSLATKSRILADLRLFDTRIAYVLMAGALLSDTATLVVFAGVLSFAGPGASAGAGLGATLSVLFQVVAFFGIAVAAGAVAPRIGQWLQEHARMDSTALGLGLMLTIGLGGAALAELFGLHAILGSFVAGMVARRGLLPSRTEKESADLLERLSIGVLAPVFFTTAGFAINLSAVSENIALVIAIIGVATVGKVLGTAAAYVPTGHGWREGVVVGAAMNGRGAVEIIVAGIGVEQGLISVEVFTVLVVMAIVTTAMVPVMLKVGVEWLRDRGELADAGGARRGVTVLGAGGLAREWALALGAGRSVSLVDTNPRRVHKARAMGLHAVIGDITDVDALREAGGDDAELVLALTPNFEVNLLGGKLAREEFGVREVRVATGPTPHQSADELLERYGCTQLGDALDVELWAAFLDTGEAKTTEVIVTGESLERGLEEQLRSGRAGLPLVMIRGEELIPFPLVDELRDGDLIMVIVRTGQRLDLPAAESRV